MFAKEMRSFYPPTAASFKDVTEYEFLFVALAMKPARRRNSFIIFVFEKKAIANLHF